MKNEASISGPKADVEEAPICRGCYEKGVTKRRARAEDKLLCEECFRDVRELEIRTGLFHSEAIQK